MGGKLTSSSGGVGTVDPPLQAPPPGVRSNYADPDTLVPALVATSAACVGVMLPFVALRLYAKGYIMRNLWWDDYTCIVATLGSIVFTITTLIPIRSGFGRHMWDVPKRYVTDQVIKELIASDFMYGPCFFFIKTSILLFYHRMFGVGGGPLLRRLIWFGIGFQLLFYAAYAALVLALFGPCGSVAGIDAGGFCESVSAAASVQASINVVTDFYVLLLPLLVVRELKLPRRRKIGVCAVFLTGLLACAASVVRLAFIPSWMRSPDGFWVGAQYSILLTLEINLGIIAACMPFLPLLFKRCVGGLRRLSASGSSATSASPATASPSAAASATDSARAGIAAVVSTPATRTAGTCAMTEKAAHEPQKTYAPLPAPPLSSFRPSATYRPESPTSPTKFNNTTRQW